MDVYGKLRLGRLGVDLCQGERMWTLMVHRYQYQLYVDACEQMAGYAIAGIPAPLVFVLTQKMILRGECVAGLHVDHLAS